MEQVISFETAKILCNCEFYMNVRGWYTKDGKFIDSHTCSNEYHEQGGYPAPTQSFLQTWLRRLKILVLVNLIDSWDSWKYTILMEDSMSPFFEPEYDKWNEFKTYESALEAGLQDALEMM